ncbi:MAG TPA: hypothetical protein PKY95_00765, partial [candidate division Zixibacteria bacterium]|nr:hypothetical protein [candidate division Zixibacteria bacterium]
MPGHIARTTGRIAALRTAGWIAAARSTGRIAAVRTAGRSTAARTVGWIAAAAAAAVLGCSGADDTAKVKQNPASEGAVTIGVSLLTRTHPFYQELEEGLKEAAGAAGFQV